MSKKKIETTVTEEGKAPSVEADDITDRRPKVEPTDVRGLIIRLQDDIMWEVMDIPLQGTKLNSYTVKSLQKIVDLTVTTRILAECVKEWVDPTIPCGKQHPGIDPIKFNCTCTKPKGHSGSCGAGGSGHNEVMWG